MQISEDEVFEIKDFIDLLNSKSESPVIVEGKRDSNALRKIGFSGTVLEFHKFGGLVKFADSVSKYKHIILLFDSDRKGRYLTGKSIELLQHRAKIDLSFKKKLVSITRGKIRFIEQLSCYESFLV